MNFIGRLIGGLLLVVLVAIVPLFGLLGEESVNRLAHSAIGNEDKARCVSDYIMDKEGGFYILGLKSVLSLFGVEFQSTYLQDIHKVCDINPNDIQDDGFLRYLGINENGD